MVADSLTQNPALVRRSTSPACCSARGHPGSVVDLTIGSSCFVAAHHRLHTCPGGADAARSDVHRSLRSSRRSASGSPLGVACVPRRPVHDPGHSCSGVLRFLGRRVLHSRPPSTWQWILSLNPLTGVIAGFAGRFSATPPAGSTAAVSSPLPLRSSATALVLPQLRAPLRGHDLMAPAISVRGAVEALPASVRSAGRLRHAARRFPGPRASLAPGKRAAARSLGAAGRVVRRRAGRGRRDHRPQRRGQEHAAQVLSRITEPTAGRATIRGRVGSAARGRHRLPSRADRPRERLPQRRDPRHERREIARKFDEIVEFAGVEPFIDTPVKRYSSGMYVRLAFAVAAHLEPEILLVDEVLAVGDAEFQRKCLGRMEDRQVGPHVLFVSHNMQAVAQLCDERSGSTGGRSSRTASLRGRRPLPAHGGREWVAMSWTDASPLRRRPRTASLRCEW